MMEISQKIVITGIIMANNWDEKGKVIEIALYTNNEEVYALEDNNLTQELINLLQRKVEIKGKIRIQPDGKKSIAVRNYMVLEEIVDEEMNTHWKEETMPSYEFLCEKCKNQYTLQLSLAEYEKKKYACPKCKSRKVKQQITIFQTKTSRKS